jgi:hypothetical protein
MARTYLYRLLKSSWGIWIKITAESMPLAGYSGRTTQAAKGLWLSVEPSWLLSADRLVFLIIGLRLVENEMQPIVQERGPLVVHVTDLQIAPCDYQDEGLACAIAGWMAEEYHLNYVHPPVYFDRERNRYQFTFPAIADPSVSSLHPLP